MEGFQEIDLDMLKTKKEVGFIYFIYNQKNNLEYIGKSSDPLSRILQHVYDKKIDVKKVMYKKFPLKDLDVQEIFYIKEFSPPKNTIYIEQPQDLSENYRKSFNAYLKENNITQTAFAKEIGYQRTYISMIVSGKYIPGKRMALAIEKATNHKVTVAELRGSKEKIEELDTDADQGHDTAA